jgi:hypothetical protein
MPKKVVIARIGESHLAFPFDNVDEILGAERMVARDQLPEDELPEGLEGESFVSSRGRWLVLGSFFQGHDRRKVEQILVLRDKDARVAYPVDQVLGLEQLENPLPMPGFVSPYLGIKYSGVHVWRNRVVLELDLSGLV